MYASHVDPKTLTVWIDILRIVVASTLQHDREVLNLGCGAGDLKNDHERGFLKVRGCQCTLKFSQPLYSYGIA